MVSKKSKAPTLNAPIKPTKSTLEPSNSESGKKLKGKGVAPIPPAESDESDNSGDEAEDSDESDEDDDGVDEDGMKRLMDALGEDGLDEIALAQLGDEEDEEDEDEDDNEESSDGGEQNGNTMGQEESDTEGSDDDEIALDDIEGEVDEDAVPRQKIVINNSSAMQRIRQCFQLDSSLPWTETLVVTYPEKLEVEDVHDDLNRELAFYKQALHCAEESRKLAQKHNLPFTRPADYFAEMVKSDAHMERVRMRLLNESASIKKSEEAKKQRNLKKFGKQVQIEKQKERDRARKDMDEKVKVLKRKRKDGIAGGGDDDFDIELEDTLDDRPAKRSHGSERGKGKPKMSRERRNSKFGVGKGGGRFSKQNDRESSSKFDFGGRSGGSSGRKGVQVKTKRLGKSRRQARR